MTTLWMKVKAEIQLLAGGFHTSVEAFEAKLKDVFESHAAEVADAHIHAEEQVSAAVAAAGVLTTEIAEAPAADPVLETAPAGGGEVAADAGKEAAPGAA